MRYTKFGLLHINQRAREVLFILFITFTFNAYSQYNLVPNGSFEDVPNCDGTTFLINSAIPWNNPTEFGTPDLLNYCNLNNVNFINEIQQPHTGNSFAGIYTGALYDSSFNLNNLREYIQVELIENLNISKIYKIQYYISLAEFGKFASNNVGIFFSDTAIYRFGNTAEYSLLTYQEQVLPFGNPIVIDTSDNIWYKVEAIFVSSGGEKFITIGNFKNDSETIYQAYFPNELSMGMSEASYYFIDDVSVTPLDSIPGGLPANAGPDQTIYIQDSVFIGQRIANLNCNWYELGGSQIASNTSGLYVQPLQTTTYVVEQILGADISYDTCTVFVEGLGLEENVLLSFEIYPNPSNSTLTLQSSQQINSPCSITITDMLGKVVYQSNGDFNKGQLTLETDLSIGSYLLSVSNEKVHLFQERLVVIK